eukprot:UN16134
MLSSESFVIKQIELGSIIFFYIYLDQLCFFYFWVYF